MSINLFSSTEQPPTVMETGSASTAIEVLIQELAAGAIDEGPG